MRTLDLPLFPLRVVLFPQMLLPLHVFEERYKQMISSCLGEDGRFGVVLIKTGAEVGGPATTHDVGTVARIIRAGRYEDGRMDLMTIGSERYRILEIDASLPYLRARVQLLRDHDDGADAMQEAQEVKALVLDYAAKVGQPVDPTELPESPESLSYLAGVLDLPLEVRQELLETLSVRERLEGLARALRQEIALTEQLGPTKPLDGVGPGFMS